jgi:hypothetical protein
MINIRNKTFYGEKVSRISHHFQYPVYGRLDTASCYRYCISKRPARYNKPDISVSVSGIWQVRYGILLDTGYQKGRADTISWISHHFQYPVYDRLDTASCWILDIKKASQKQYLFLP